MMALLTASMPVAAFAQDGIVARTQPAQTQTAKPSANPAQPAGVVTATSAKPAQDPAQQTGQNNPITRPLALSPEVSDVRVGVDLSQVQALRLQDAISVALQNNLDIEQFRQGVQISQFSLNSLRGVYDIVSSADINYRSQTVPVASIFGGGGSTSSLTSRSITTNFSTNQLFERTGGTWQVDFDSTRLNTSSTASTLTTQYTPVLTFTFSQPLLRNFNIDINRRQIQIAKKAVDLSDSLFRQRVIEIINQVQRAYWDLVFAIRNEQIARKSVELARTQLDNNQKQVEAGTLAPIDLREAEAALEQRKGDVIVALQGITTAENVLKGLLIKDQGDKLWNSVINPVDEPQLTPTTVNIDEATRLALQNRPELDQIRLQTEQKNIDIAFYKNQLKPQVDLIGFYTNNGLAGTPSEAVRSSGGFDQTTQGVLDNLNLALNRLNLTPFTPTPPPASTVSDGVPSRFQGGFFRSLGNLFGQDFKTYQFGVRVSLPWRNRTAQGNYGRSLAEARQLDARQRQIVQGVQIDVRNALQAVEASRLRYEAAKAQRLAANAQFTGEQEKFRAGLSTTFLVLQRQTDLSVAEGNEVRALTDYNKALSDLQRVTGMTLVSNNVQVTARDDSSTNKKK
jgi:HAE1 family hydrophobic/amphiphilic exporter-1